MDRDDLMVFQEYSTGKWLAVEESDEQFKYNSYLFDKNKKILNKARLSFPAKNLDGLSPMDMVCNAAMKFYGINNSNVHVGKTEDILQELKQAKIEIQKEKAQNALGFKSFEEIKEQYPNAVDLSNSDKKKWSYKEVTDYLKSIVNDVMVTSDGDKIAISDDYRHIEESSDYTKLNRRGKEEIKTYAAEIKKLVANSEYEKEIDNKDSAKVDVEKFKYYTVPVWINNRAYNVLLECGQLKNETSDSATRKGASNDTFTEVSKEKHIRKRGKLQVLDVSYLYNIRNRPLTNKIEKSEEISVEKYNELAKKYNELLSAYKKSQEENKKLQKSPSKAKAKSRDSDFGIER